MSSTKVSEDTVATFTELFTNVIRPVNTDPASAIILQRLRELDLSSLTKVKQFDGGGEGTYLDWYVYADALDAMEIAWSVEIPRVLQNDNMYLALVVRITINGMVRENVGWFDKNKPQTNLENGDPFSSAFNTGLRRCCALFGLARDLWAKDYDRTDLPMTHEQLGQILTIEKDYRIPTSGMKKVETLVEQSSGRYNHAQAQDLIVMLKDAISKGQLKQRDEAKDKAGPKKTTKKAAPKSVGKGDGKGRDATPKPGPAAGNGRKKNTAANGQLVDSSKAKT